MQVESAEGVLVLAMLMIIIAGAFRLAVQVEKRRLSRLFQLVHSAVYQSCATCHNGKCSISAGRGR